MENDQGRNTESKGITTDNMKSTADEDITTDSESVWQTPSRLKEEVQTIIDIMGPPLSPKFTNNTSSEADNEESVFTNSKFSTIRFKPHCDCHMCPERPDVPCKDEGNISTAADVNTTTISSTLDDPTETHGMHSPKTQYICPPPFLSPNAQINPTCTCPQSGTMFHCMPSYIPNKYVVEEPNAVANVDSRPQNDLMGQTPITANKDSLNAIVSWLKTIVSSHKTDKGCACPQYYKMNVKKTRGNDNSPPRRVVFELVPSLPKYDQSMINEPEQKPCCSPNDKKNMDQEKMINLQFQPNVHHESCKHATDHNCHTACPTGMKRSIEQTSYCDSGGKTRVDVYYFDRGSFNHFSTTDAPPLVSTEQVADKTEKATTRFWAEIFGTLHIGLSFMTSFVLQLWRFLLYSICRPLTIGIIQLTSDYFFKPMLATLFNGVLQPVLIFGHNIAASLRDLCDPIAEGIGYFLGEFGVLVRAFRIVEVSRGNHRECHKYPVECKNEKRCKKSKVIC